ncbi:MAG: hypothetical protein WB562_04770 [Candidatus Sulfotelmatobacter sp.]
MPEQGMERPVQPLAPRNGHWVVILIVAVGLATVGIFSYLNIKPSPAAPAAQSGPK